jgi:hypothetical protein
LTIQPGGWILAGSMLRLLVPRLPTLHSALRCHITDIDADSSRNKEAEDKSKPKKR